jgi:hypothetical protein
VNEVTTARKSSVNNPPRSWSLKPRGRSDVRQEPIASAGHSSAVGRHSTGIMAALISAVVRHFQISTVNCEIRQPESCGQWIVGFSLRAFTSAFCFTRKPPRIRTPATASHEARSDNLTLPSPETNLRASSTDVVFGSQNPGSWRINRNNLENRPFFCR